MPNHLAPFKLIGRVPEGACQECAFAHPPEDPHNRDSLTYQYKFYAEHGRWPTWDDAMAHLEPGYRVAWTSALRDVLAAKGMELVDGVPMRLED